MAPLGRLAFLSNAADRVMVSGGGKLLRVAAAGDHHAPAIAADGREKSGRCGAPARVPSLCAQFRRRALVERAEAHCRQRNNIWPRLVSDGRAPALVWQGFRNNQAVILARQFERRWSAERQVSEGAGNCWARPLP
jgi:hypothetical protein